VHLQDRRLGKKPEFRPAPHSVFNPVSGGYARLSGIRGAPKLNVFSAVSRGAAFFAVLWISVTGHCDANRGNSKTVS